MNLNKQFINVIGAVLVLAVLVAGIALIAVPMWSQSQATDASTRGVAQTNSLYQAQIDQLSAAEARGEEIDAHLADLRAEIAPFTRLDDAFEIIIAAADKHELVIESATAGDPEPFAARAAIVEEMPAAAPPASADEPAEPNAEGAAPTAEAPTPASDESSAQQQVAMTITVAVPEAAAATAFIDDLRVGPRLMSIIDATFSGESLTVTALTYIRTEG